MLCFRSGSSEKVTCYGTPKGERRKKPKKSVSESKLKGIQKSDMSGDRGVDYTQISSRIIALTFPTTGSDSAYRSSVKEISETLKKGFGDKYKIFNVSQKRSDLGRSNVGAVVELGWPDQLAPPLDKLCSICKQIETWLNANSENLAVIHCKGWRSRAAIVIASYMHYINICASEETVADRFSMQMFSEKYLGIDGQPSHKRYVKYFANLLSGITKVNTTPIFLTQITLYRMNSKSVVLKIYERMKPVYSTGQITLKEVSRVDLENGGLSVRGDVLVKCFEKSSSQDRILLFQCQFNTCALNLDPTSPILRFFKDELDLISQDKFDSQASIEFSFLLEPPKNGSVKKQGHIHQTVADFSRADSYENFDRPEDDRSVSSSVDVPVYSELTKQQPTDGADSGIGSDSPKASKDSSSSAPMVPPKPRRDSDFGTDSINGGLEDAYRSAYEDSVIGRDHSVLPSSLRPKNSPRAHSPQASSEGGRSTPRVAEPDLLPPDRYDRSSKCFSYVPAKSLKEHYTAPKKPPQRRPSVERSNLDIPESVARESLREVNLTPIDLTRRPETPKWDAEIDKVCPIPLQNDFPERSRKNDYHRSIRDFESPHTSAYEKNFTNGYTNSSPKKAYSTNYLEDEDMEQPMVIDQAKKAPRAKRRGRYGSFSTLNDDEYASDMDDFMDPDFYMTYSSANTPQPDRSARFKTAPPQNSGSKSVELPRKSFNAISQKELDEIENIIESTATLPPPRSCLTPNPKPQPSASDRDSFRYRNCRSVTSAPIHRERKLFSNDRYDSITDCDNPDDWLKMKLKALHSKRFMDPFSMQRRNAEKILLEELKNANSERDLSKNEYTSEGMGKKVEEDPLEEYKKEEERLRNTRSPFADLPQHQNQQQRVGTPNSIGDPRKVLPPRGATPTGQIIREKPPTPPPRGERDRSRSPARSPLVVKKRPQTADLQKSIYQKERDRIANTDYLSDDEDENGEFSHLKTLVGNNRLTNHELNGNGTLSSQYSTTKSILKKREQNDTPTTSSTPTADIYASPIPANRRLNAQTPVEESPRTPSSIYGQNQSALQQRSETPAFPVNSRETPLPFHPLLYQGAITNGTDTYHQNTSMTNRSASPRSMYYGNSRRSSLTSDTGEVIHHHPVFVKDTSKYWYKPNISREEAINMLRDKPPGTFVVRDSNSFPGAFGLALKVSQPPAGVPTGDGTELVRHFLIEPSPKGVKLKGCNNEPIFGSLAALVYQHSITPMALPTKLILPEYDPAASPEHLNAAQALLEQGAACNVTYICSYDTESLTGPEAVRRTISEAFSLFSRGAIKPVSVHFKVSAQGITLTDNTRTLFFRRHYPVLSVTHAGVDPEERRWDNNNVLQLPPTYVRQAKIFGFVARKIPTRQDNACHVFAELDPEQPANAVVNFITKVMMGQGPKKSPYI